MKKSEIKAFKKIVKKIKENKKEICKRFDIDKKELKVIINEAEDILEHGSDKEIEAFAEAFAKGFENKIAELFEDDFDKEFKERRNEIKHEQAIFDQHFAQAEEMMNQHMEAFANQNMFFDQHVNNFWNNFNPFN